MSLPSSTFPETLLARISTNTRRHITQQALLQDKNAIESLLRKLQLYKAWGSQSQQKKVDMLADIAKSNASICHKLLQLWCARNGTLKQQVQKDLLAAGYTPKAPDFRQKQFALPFQTLRETDIISVDDQQYFAPGGVAVSTTTPEYYTLMAHLLGWSVLENELGEEELEEEELEEEENNTVTSQPQEPLVTLATPLQENADSVKEKTPAFIGEPQGATDVEEWEIAVEQLAVNMKKLASQYEAAALCLRQEEWPYLSGSEDEVSLRREVLQLGQRLGLPADPKADKINQQVPSLATLRLHIQEQRLAQTAAQQQVQLALLQRQEALRVLSGVRHVQHKSAPNFSALLHLQEQAAELSAKLEASELGETMPEEQALVSGEHEFSQFLSLVRLADHYSKMGDEEDAVHQAHEVMQALGGTSLMTAWSRGNLIEIAVEASLSTLATGEPSQGSIAKPAALIFNESISKESLAIPIVVADAPPIQIPTTDDKQPLTEEVEGTEHAANVEELEPVDIFFHQPTASLGETIEEETQIIPVASTKSKTSVHATTSPAPVSLGKVKIDIVQPTLGLSKPTAEEIGRRQWELLERDEVSLAFHLSRCAEELGWETGKELPAWLLRSVLLGPRVKVAYGRIASVLSEDGVRFDQTLLNETLEEHNGARHLLAWGAALRPSLVAPATSLGGWLSIGGVPGLPNLNDFVRRIAQRQNATPLDESLLGAVHTQQQWEEQLQEWQEQLDEWISQQEQAKFRQSPTNDIVQFWKSCRQSGRPVARVLTGLKAAEPNHAELLDMLATLRDRSTLRDEMKRSKIKFSIHIQDNTDAQRWLDERVTGLTDLVRQHQELWQRRPSGPAHKDALHDDRELISYLNQHLPIVKQELSEAEIRSSSEPQPNRPWLVALRLCQQALQQLHRWLTNPSIDEGEAAPRYLLGQALLRVPATVLNAEWEPQYDATLWEQLWNMTQQEFPSWSALYEAACHETPEFLGADHLATARLLALAEADAANTLNMQVSLGQDLAELRSARTASLRQQPRELDKAIDRVERELVRGQRYGYLSGEDNERAKAEVKDLRRISQSQTELEEDSIYNFRAHHLAVRRLQEQIAGIRTRAIDERSVEVERELSDLSVMPSPDDQLKLRQVLHEGRLALVEDYMARLRAGRDLGPHGLTTVVPCIAQLRVRLQQLLEVQQQQKPAALGRHIEQYSLLPDGLSPSENEGIASAYSHWIEVKQSKSLASESSRQSYKQLLEFIGFEVETLGAATSLDRAGHQYFDLHTATLRERRQCPVGRFGSEAKGQYRVLSLWSMPEPAELSRLVGKCSNPHSAVLVFVWEALPWKKREELGIHCRREGLTFLVFDELLLLYLLTYGAISERLALFFKLQLPFTQLNPYLVSGKIPSEMFYGRASEKTRLVSHKSEGAIIIYGGRQLGKTMLLHQAVRENHRPNEEHYVVFLDIYQLGRDIKNIDRIGFELMQLFRAQKIGDWPVSWHENITPRRVLDHLIEWVSSVKQRTLLILLDEADELLEQDAANDFALVSEFRNAMQKTDLRLKVVFSGLHNVQRTLNLPNQPFVQFGSPMSIGPLIPEQGVDLVRTPLESMGFCFGRMHEEDGYQTAEALIDQIAVETNYYPSLIQIFCHRLLEGLYQRQQRHPTLLTHISEDDVQRASQDARSEISNRFNLTLDLNPRYRLLAYIIADFTTQAASPKITARGMLPTEVREWALEYWPAGWKHRHEESYFKALLDEMVELGVLEKSESGRDGWRYRLRTANVRALLGPPDTIRHVLSSFVTEQPNAEYMPSVVHAEFPAGAKAKPPHFRGPLTVEAVRGFEGGAGVSIVCGTKAAGLGQLSGFLARRFRGNFEAVENITQFGQLEKRLHQLLADKTEQSVKVILVSGNCTGKWIQQTLTELRPGGHSRKRPIHVVFEMDPDTLRRFLSADITLEQLQEQGVKLLPLAPWEPAAVKHWLHKEMLADGAWKEVVLTTGGWHLLLQEFFDLESTQPQSGMHLQQLAQEMKNGRHAEDFHLPAMRPFMQELARNWGEDTFGLEEAEVANSEPMTKEDMLRELRWAEILRFIYPHSEGRFEFDPVVATVLRHGS